MKSLSLLNRMRLKHELNDVLMISLLDILIFLVSIRTKTCLSFNPLNSKQNIRNQLQLGTVFNKIKFSILLIGHRRTWHVKLLCFQA